jgi:predicted AAA+ superfamily ATPase
VIQVLRRLSGERTEASAFFNLSTQFGGGKTHALTLLYHLGVPGPAAMKRGSKGWRLQRA